MSKLGLSKSWGGCSVAMARLKGPSFGPGTKAMSLSNSRMSSWREKKDLGISIAFLEPSHGLDLVVGSVGTQR